VHDLLVELKDPNRTVVKAVNTRPRITKGLSLWEWNLIRARQAEAGKADLMQVGENELILRKHELNRWLREQAEKNRRVVRSVQRQAESRARAAEAALDNLDPTPRMGSIDEMPAVAGWALSNSQVPTPETGQSATETEVQDLPKAPVADREHTAATLGSPNLDQKAPSTPLLPPSDPKRQRSALDDFLDLADEPVRPFPTSNRQIDILHK